jgi:hypothetical protein
MRSRSLGLALSALLAVACSRPAQCRTAAVTKDDGSQSGAVLSSAVVGGMRYIVYCNLWTATRSPLPPPCGALIRLE